MAFMLLSALAATAMNASVHHMADEMEPVKIAFFRALFGFVVLAPVFLCHGWGPLRTRRLWLAAIGALGGLFQFCLSQALKEADATAVMPLDFTKLIWAALISCLVFAEVPTLWT
jgi:drug/metabolite transporter (DMT)-like permease